MSATARSGGAVSAIVPAHDSARTIGRCIESVLAQTHPVREIVVVDDASTDQTASIAAGYGCTVIRLPANAGASTARNRGIAATRGETLFFLDSDVVLAPDAVETAVAMLAERPGYASVSGIYATRPLIDDGLVQRCQVLHAHYWRRRNEGTVSSGYFSLGAFRRSALDTVGRFDERIRASDSEDTEYGFRIAEQYPMLLTTAVWGYHDDDHALGPILRKYFHRVASVLPMLVRQRHRRTVGTAGRAARHGRETAFRPGHLIPAALAPVSVPLVVVHPMLGVLPPLLLGWFCVAEPQMLRFVRREAGWRMLVPYLALHYLACLAVAAGTVVGVLRLVGRRSQWPGLQAAGQPGGAS